MKIMTASFSVSEQRTVRGWTFCHLTDLVVHTTQAICPDCLTPFRYVLLALTQSKRMQWAFYERTSAYFAWTPAGTIQAALVYGFPSVQVYIFYTVFAYG